MCYAEVTLQGERRRRKASCPLQRCQTPTVVASVLVWSKVWRNISKLNRFKGEWMTSPHPCTRTVCHCSTNQLAVGPGDACAESIGEILLSDQKPSRVACFQASSLHSYWARPWLLLQAVWPRWRPYCRAFVLWLQAAARRPNALWSACHSPRCTEDPHWSPSLGTIHVHWCGRLSRWMLGVSGVFWLVLLKQLYFILTNHNLP